MRVNEGLSLAVFGGEPMVLFWRAEDFDEALGAALDMGLPLTTTAGVGAELGLDPDLFGPDSAEAADIEDLDRWRPDEEEEGR